MLDRTGLSVVEHQRRTVENLLELRHLGPAAHVIPVLQGWELDDYWRCMDRYAAAGIDLTSELVVGVGTVCRRQHTDEAAALLEALAGAGLRIHGFGLKMGAVEAVGDLLASSDSMAWSYNARMNPRMEGCTHRSPRCAHCPRWAMAWRARLLERVGSGRVRQSRLPFDRPG